MGVRGLFAIDDRRIRQHDMSQARFFVFALVFLIPGFCLSGCWSSSTSTTGDKWVNVSSSPQPNVSKSNDVPQRAENETKEPTANRNGEFSKSLPTGFVQPTDDVGNRLLKEYGALFVAKGGAKPPDVVIFKNEEEVFAYQTSLSKRGEVIGGIAIELQSAAMDALKLAVQDAKSENLTITPRGKDAARRTYTGTVELWKSKVDPGLTHWTKLGRIPDAEALRIRSLSPFQQVPEIFKLESQGIFFSKDLSKSIIYSVAPPGTSQHLSMLALDIVEHDDYRVREILALNGWFQTVVSDLPHFTYLGVAESELTELGLRNLKDGRSYWVPKL